MADFPEFVLRTGYTAFLRPLLFRVDPERVHEETIAVLGRLPSAALALLRAVVGAPDQPVTVAGVQFPGRVGVAAGLDKDGVAARAWANLGFGFAEFGTVTAQPQPGNPSPRLFRVPQLHGFVNRMGFNNSGAAGLAARLEHLGVARGNAALGLPVGVSLGKTKDVPLAGAVTDYLESLNAVAPVADYIAVNVSSPNTPGLRDLQGAEELSRLVSALAGRAGELDSANPVPIFVKLAPDLSDDALLEVVRVCEREGAAGLIAVNTTLWRPEVSGLSPTDDAALAQAGGLSGSPLRARARHVVRLLADASNLPVIASGAVMTPVDAKAMFDAGAWLVQVLSGFIYYGPALVRGINRLGAQ